MDTKLTLKLNQKVIENAKKYAADQKLSLSRLIESYLQSLTLTSVNNDAFEISPFVKSIATGKSLPNNIDHKKTYSNYLIEKHK